MNKFDSDEIVNNSNFTLPESYGRVKYKNIKPNKKILLLIAGNILGILFFYITGGDDIILADSFWGSGFLENENTGLFQYIFALRLKQIIFLIICSFSYVGKLLEYGFCASMGFEFGLILFTFAYNYKIKGIILGGLMILPHGIFYLLLVLMIFEGFCEGKKTTILWKIAMGMILFALGFLCETCINYELIQKMSELIV